VCAADFLVPVRVRFPGAGGDLVTSDECVLGLQKYPLLEGQHFRLVHPWHFRPYLAPVW
jgi:hypothetical protein